MKVSFCANQPINQTSQNKKQKITDRFNTYLKNSSDMSDCITVPRTIFKGYLGIMIGTALTTIGSFIKQPAIKKSLILSGIASSTYGTWSFVRPYIIKGSVPSIDLNKENKSI